MMTFYMCTFLCVFAVVVDAHAGDQDLLQKFEELERQITSQNALLLRQQDQSTQQGALLDVLQATIMQQQDKLVRQENHVTSLEHQIRQMDSGRDRRLILDDAVVGQIAFNARMDVPALTNIALNQTIVYSTVVTNLGSGYNPTTGVFTAPKPGLYLFSCTLTSDASHFHEVYVSIMKTGQPVGQVIAHGDSGHPDQSSSTVLVTLLTGDKVHVDLSGKEAGTTIRGQMDSNFVGVLINSV